MGFSSQPPLILDLDDDGDNWSDDDEVACGTDGLDESSIPTDDDSEYAIVLMTFLICHSH